MSEKEPNRSESENLHYRQPEAPLDPENALVISSLIEARPRLKEKPGEYVIKSAKTDKPVVVALGPPGNGKSTLLEELSRLLDEDIEYSLYDNHLSTFEDENGPREYYSRSKWLELNTVISTNILELKYEIVDPSKKRVILAEVPGVGSTAERNVGVDATRTLFEDAAENGGILFVYTVSNPLLEVFSGLLRQAVVDAQPEEVLNILAKHNLKVKDVDDPVDMGRKIQDAYKKAAQPQHINRIKGEMKQLISDWATIRGNVNFTKAYEEQGESVSRDVNLYDPRIIKRDGMQGPPGVTIEKIDEIYKSFNKPLPESFKGRKTSSLIEESIDQALYMEDMFKQYCLKEDQALVLYNVFYPGVMTTDPAYIGLHSG
jgi:hypothetical protein